jgi:hypothetical protein
MARTARTRGISMTPEVAALWDRLRGDRRPAQFLRELLVRESERRAEEEASAALRWLEEVRASVPPSWRDPELLRIGEDEHEEERALPPLPQGATVTLSDGTQWEVERWRPAG